MDENTGNSVKNNRYENLKKYQFKPGVSGNPSGRPKGAKSMKTYAKEYLESMSEEDRIEFMNSIDPKIIWEMAEGKAKQDMDVTTDGKPMIVRLNE